MGQAPGSDAGSRAARETWAPLRGAFRLQCSVPSSVARSGQRARGPGVLTWRGPSRCPVDGLCSCGCWSWLLCDEWTAVTAPLSPGLLRIVSPGETWDLGKALSRALQHKFHPSLRRCFLSGVGALTAGFEGRRWESSQTVLRPLCTI